VFLKVSLERGVATELSGVVALEHSASKTTPAILLFAKPPLDIDSFTNFAATSSLVKAAFS
jgi:hypothetical protein